MKQFTITLSDGFRVGVTHGGAGIPLVFLHGFSVSAGAYTEMLELLAANGFEVFALDAPDHGRSDALPWGHTVKDMVYVIAAALDNLNVPPNCVVVGHSMGGWLAAEYAAEYSDWVDHLILLDAAVGDDFHEATRAGGISTLLRGARFVAGALRDVVGDARKAGSVRTLTDRLRLMDILRGSVSGASCLRAAHAMMKGDSRDALRALRTSVRTTVVHGYEDSIVPVGAAHQAWQSAWGSIHLIGGAYHSWMIADPELALEVIRDALDLTSNEDDDASPAV